MKGSSVPPVPHSFLVIVVERRLCRKEQLRKGLCRDAGRGAPADEGEADHTDGCPVRPENRQSTPVDQNKS